MRSRTAATLGVAHLCLALLLVGLIASAGCTACSDCSDEYCAAQCDATCQPCGCPGNPFAGKTPAWRPTGAIGEAEAEAESGPVNEAALLEPKGGGGCADCQQPAPQMRPIARPVYRIHGGHASPPIPLRPGESVVSVGPWRVVSPRPSYTHPSYSPQPSTMPSATPAPRRPDPQIAPAYLEDSREGIFRCARCRESKVGREWHEVWGDDDTPLTILCEKCWRQTSVQERRAYLDAYMKSAGLDAYQRFHARAAYAE